MEHITLALAISAFVLSFLALAASLTAAVMLVGLRNSTHKVVQVPVDPGPTQYAWDLPPDVMDKLPSEPEPRTPEQYLKQMQSGARSLDDLYEQL